VSKPEKAVLTCPQCGAQQWVAPAAFSAVCKQCGQYLRVQELLKPSPKAPAPAPAQKRIVCFDCQAEFEVPASAQSTMCKKCSCYIDLHDYSITNAVSKNFKTRGSFVIQPSGYVFNSETVATDAAIKGRFIGKLIVERSLTLYASAKIKGPLHAAHLIIPAANQIHWEGKLEVGSAEINGELAADLHAKAVHVQTSGALTGTLTAASLIIDAGAAVKIAARIGLPEGETTAPAG
jgi:cytoskeletal protein CcmA (bactofilin family)